MKNIMICGPKGIGKTTLIHKYLYNCNITEYLYTVGVQILSNDRFSLWETPFEEISRYIQYVDYVILLSDDSTYFPFFKNVPYSTIENNSYSTINSFTAILEGLS